MADLIITAGSVIPGADAQYYPDRKLAGVALTAGQAVYLDSAGLWQLSDANGAAALRAVNGVVSSACGAGQPATVQIGGSLAIGATVAVNNFYVASATPGGIAPIADLVGTVGWYGLVLGWGISVTSITLRPFTTGVAT